MGVQTMSSLGGGGGGGGGGAGVLSRQGSVYGLTLNEVQSHLGEPLRSMNLEDLLRTVLPAAAAGPEQHAPGKGKRTVDEVWRDIESAGCGRQPTVGEMTLEDFLSRAGVPVDGGGGACGAGASAHWLHQYRPPHQYVARPLPRPLGVGAGPVLDAMYHDGGRGRMFLSQVGGGRKRGAALVGEGEDGVVEKTVERRQKRMIKNRESAARSRARKQAYTNELENKIAKLEEEIGQLKELKKLEPMLQFMQQPEQQPGTEEQHQQLLRQVILYMPRPEPEPEPNQHHLRRTNSASF